jgi:hypothetical protein
MKHVKLFEQYNQGRKAISVFPEGGDSLYVGIFFSDVADDIYNQLNQVNRNSQIDIIEVPEGHDIVISELGGEGLSTISKVDHESMTGEELPPIVELGVDNYDFPETTDGYGAIPFSARMEGGFTCINGLGMTYLVSQNEMVKIAGRY